jgi:type I restriction enzyme M protein
MTLLSLADIARRAGVERAAVSNWRRRHSDTFPEPVEQEGRELFRADEIVDWLDRRKISRASLLPGEVEGSTYGDRFRAAEPTVVAPRTGDDLGLFWARTLRQPALQGLHDAPEALLDLVVLRLRNEPAWTALFRSGRPPAEALDDFLSSRDHGPYLATPGDSRVRQVSALLAALDALAPPPDDAGWAALAEEFLDATAEWLGRRTEHHTPRSIVQVMLEVTLPRPHESLCDPCCGTGALLTGAAGWVDGPVRGHALGSRSARIAALALELRGRQCNVTDDAVPMPEGSRDHYDVVISNPPFNLRFGERPWNGRFGRIPPRSVSFAWLCDAYERLVPFGRAAVVTPIGSVSSGGDERELRAALVDAGVVERIITFPSRLFLNTSIPVTLWVLRKSRSDSVLMVDGSGLGHMADRSHRRLGTEDIAILTSAKPGMHARRVPLSEIRDREYDLTPARYVSAPDSGGGERGDAERDELLSDRLRALADAERAVQRADEIARLRLRRIAGWEQ